MVSAASFWEIEIKRRLGWLDAPEEPVEMARAYGFAPLDVTAEHAMHAGRLPLHHGDPFDRMLVAQAQLEGLILVTADEQLRRYEVPTMDARPGG